MEKNSAMQDVMVMAAKDLVTMAPDPGNWAGWVIYLLESLDEESVRSEKQNDYELTLAGLQDAIGTRLSSGKW